VLKPSACWLVIRFCVTRLRMKSSLHPSKVFLLSRHCCFAPSLLPSRAARLAQLLYPTAADSSSDPRYLTANRCNRPTITPPARSGCLASRVTRQRRSLDTPSQAHPASLTRLATGSLDLINEEVSTLKYTICDNTFLLMENRK
jgi:hypothetical protein